MASRSRFRLAMGLKVCAIAVCIALVFRGHPPAMGQHAQTEEDARQDDAISTLRENTDKSEAVLAERLDKVEIEMQAIHDDERDGRNENRFEFGGIGLLYGSGVLVGRRKKSEAA